MNIEPEQRIVKGKQVRIVEGKDLKTGDTIVVWWKPGWDTIKAFHPQEFNPHLPDGARTAEFAIGNDMTIDNTDDYEVLI